MSLIGSCGLRLFLYDFCVQTKSFECLPSETAYAHANLLLVRRHFPRYSTWQRAIQSPMV